MVLLNFPIILLVKALELFSMSSSAANPPFLLTVPKKDESMQEMFEKLHPKFEVHSDSATTFFKIWDSLAEKNLLKTEDNGKF